MHFNIAATILAAVAAVATDAPTLPTFCQENHPTIINMEAWANCCYKNDFANCPVAHCKAKLVGVEQFRLPCACPALLRGRILLQPNV